MSPIDLDKLALNNSGNPLPKKRMHRQSYQKFLKGPIPWLWLCRAAMCPGKCLQVAIALWFISGIKKSNTLTLTNVLLQELGVDRHAKHRALNWLQQAGLISMVTSDRKNPLVTILEVVVTPKNEQ